MKAKFRIWDIQEKKMAFEGFHLFGEVTLFSAIDNYLFETRGGKSALERYNDLVEMQWIGRRDCDGKDIYDGDLIEIQWLDEDVTCERISYDEVYGYWKYGNNPMCELMDPEIPIKVIGNIYDHYDPKF